MLEADRLAQVHGWLIHHEVPPKVPDVTSREVLVTERELDPFKRRLVRFDRAQHDRLTCCEPKGVGYQARERDAHRALCAGARERGHAQHQRNRFRLLERELDKVARREAALIEHITAEQQLLIGVVGRMHEQRVGHSRRTRLTCARSS